MGTGGFVDGAESMGRKMSTDKQALEVFRVALERMFGDGSVRLMFCAPSEADHYAVRYSPCNKLPLVRLSDAQAAIAKAIKDEREACARVCAEWARICDSGKRHGAKVGAQECEKLILARKD